MEKIILLTDGGSRGNPGNSAYGFVVYKGREKIYEEGRRIGITTNNVAEYTAIVRGLTWIADNIKGVVGEVDLDKIGVEVLLDSLLACQQLRGIYRIKQPHLMLLAQQVKDQQRRFSSVTYQHIPREKNKEADAMVNMALDNT